MNTREFNFISCGKFRNLIKDIIVISANYRLGVFGFWFHPDFEAGMDEKWGLPYDDIKTYSGNQA